MVLDTKKKYLIGLSLAFVIGFALNYAVGYLRTLHNESAPVDMACEHGECDEEENIPTTPVVSAPQPQPVENENDIILTVGNGDTIAKLLRNSGIDSNQSHALIKELNKTFSMKSLRIGQELVITVDKKDGYKKLTQLKFRPTFNHEYVAILDKNGNFSVEKREIELLYEVKWAVGTINGSIYQSAVSNGVPSKIIRDMIAAYSHDVDFQHGLKSDDKFALMYEISTDPETNEQRAGNLLYAGLLVGGEYHHVYRFKPKSGVYEYYNHKGEAVKKGLLKMPVDGARLSSTFGNRKHPVLGYTKHHRGVDYAVPKGTPIMASGEGVITKIGPWGAYGNYLQIRHNGEYSTAYAHLSRYAKGMKLGYKVRQGTVIGYVGATGRTTGPHLHYEVLKNNKHINPLSVKMVSSKKLIKRDLMAFNKAKGSIDQHYAALGQGEKFNLAEVSTFLSATVDFKNIAVSENIGEKGQG